MRIVPLIYSVLAMARLEKFLEKILLGYSDANIDFADLLRLLSALGFNERVRAVITYLVRRA